MTDMETGVRAVHRAPGRALAWRPDGLRGVKKGPSTGHVALAARLIPPPPPPPLPEPAKCGRKMEQLST